MSRLKNNHAPRSHPSLDALTVTLNPGSTTGPKLGAKFAVEPVQVGQVSLRAEGEPESNAHELGISLWAPNLEELRRMDEE